MRATYLTLFFAIVCLSAASAQSVENPRPKYPYECRARGITGSGIVLLEVDTKTGKVRKARMLKSTGHYLLDRSAIEAFSQWHFRPETTAPEVKIPISFSLPKKPGSK
jgi:TonB family protein